MEEEVEEFIIEYIEIPEEYVDNDTTELLYDLDFIYISDSLLNFLPLQ
jgi:hypothetical protein